MPTYLGVDAGGTRTRLVLIDDTGAILARGEAGPGNLRRGGPRGLSTALRAARAAAGLDRPAGAAFLGVAGAVTPAELELVRALGEAVGLAPAGRVRAGHDLLIAHSGAFGTEPGIVVIAGTGSAAFGRDGAGGELRSGVWDHAPDDPGSGYDLGRHALELFRAAPVGSGARRALEAFVSANLAPDALQRLYDGGALARGEVAALAPAVLAAVERGDEPARAALLTGIRSLCVCIRYVRAELPGAGDAVAVVGGMTGSRTWMRELNATLGRMLPAARLVPAREEPVLGAARLALLAAR
jgi:N-acetylglucosamine kinase-like BadF-type ATPase